MKSRITDLFASHSEVVTVDELTLRIRNVLTADASLRSVRLRGELQGLKKHSSGHTYFTLLGQEARVAGVLFRSDASGVVQWAQDGEEVYVEGRIDVYAAEDPINFTRLGCSHWERGTKLGRKKH
jgi:Exodeoxyribonuclease VII large subunit (EC 3.1.11.6)